MMKNVIRLLLAMQIVCWGCSMKQENGQGTDALHFDPVAINSVILTGEVQMLGNLESGQLQLKAELKNISSEKISINEVRVESESGIQAKWNNPFQSPVEAQTKEEMGFSLSFTPINDFELYMLTGKAGLFNRVYNVSFIMADKEGVKTVRIQTSIPEEVFRAYREKVKQHVVGYQFNKSPEFEDNQRNYLDSLKLGTNFIHVSEQEIAVAGLNFRLQSYWENDTLRARLSVVNHAEFQVVLDTAAYDVVNSKDDVKRKLKYYKVTGFEHEPDLLRKGDRIVIELTKPLSDTTSTGFEVLLKKTFMLENGKNLFFNNPLVEKI